MPKNQRTVQRSQPRVRWTREASGLVVMVVAVIGAILAYSGLFGALGDAMRAVADDVVGAAGAAIFLVGALGGLAALLGRPRLGRRPWLGGGILVLGIAAGVAVIRSGLRLVVPGPGGVAGALLGWLLAHVAGTVGGAILATVVALVGCGLLLGVLSRDGLHRLAARLRPPLQEAPRATGPRRARSKPSLVPAAGPRTQPSSEGLVGPEVLAPDRVVEARAVEARPDDVPRVREAVGPWRLPDPSLLARGARAEIDRDDLERRGRMLEASLASHGVAVHITGMTVGPTVTRYELELAEGVKVARVLSLQRDIAYAMAAVDVRILAPIPGKRAIGIEVPNRVREVVTLGDVLTTRAMARASGVLEVPLGKDIAGQTAVFDLAAMPHVLVAGSTGAGKSSLLNSLLTSLLLRTTPAELRLILVDPKRVEMSQYAGLPHLLTSVVVDPKKAALALAWAVEEMERRYQILAHWGVRDIVGYRELVALARDSGEAGEEPPEELPYILIMIDELNDLMMAAPRDVEDSICRIAQKARAVGVHLVIATQRPSVDVITGVIKTNIPSRIAFAVASQTDSRVILDQPGAEKLVGKGDLLVVTASTSQPRRLQAPWVSESEVAAVVGHWRRQGAPVFIEELERLDEQSRIRAEPSARTDELLGQAARLVVESGSGSTSMLQRRLKVGFARAGRLMDLLEERGIVGPSEGSKQRQVLVSKEELDELDL